MDKAEVGFQYESIFANVVLEHHRVSLLQGLTLCKVGIIHNNTLIMAMAMLFLYIRNQKMRKFIRSPFLP